MSEDLNALYAIQKAEIALMQCKRYFEHQGEMNAAGHMANQVLYPPIHGVIVSAVQGLIQYRSAQTTDRKDAMRELAKDGQQYWAEREL